MTIDDSALIVRAHASPWRRGVELLIREPRRPFFGSLVMTTIADGDIIPPTCGITFGAAQLLMDDLWTVGVRPTEGAGSAGAMRACENHLADMRRIVWHLMKIKPERKPTDGR